MKVEVFRYVAHEDIAAYKRRGWVVVSDMKGSHHGYYGVLMKCTEEREGARRMMDVSDNEEYFSRQLANATIVCGILAIACAFMLGIILFGGK